MVQPTTLPKAATASEDALLSALREASPLAGLFEPLRYLRELRTHTENDGTISMQLDRLGFRRYKNRYGKKPLKNPMPINPEKVRGFLNKAIDPQFYITAVVDEGTFVKIFFTERKQR